MSIQQVLDHTTAIDFKENYTDPTSDFFRHYAPALNMAWLPGAADVQPGQSKIYGVHDFLSQFIHPDARLKPGAAFDYNSSNTDLLGWLIARISVRICRPFCSAISGPSSAPSTMPIWWSIELIRRSLRGA